MLKLEDPIRTVEGRIIITNENQVHRFKIEIDTMDLSGMAGGPTGEGLVIVNVGMDDGRTISFQFLPADARRLGRVLTQLEKSARNAVRRSSKKK